jgi:GTP cyclohydrolase I
MKCRGVKKQNAVMTTSAMRGVFFDKAEARSEVLQLIRNSPVQG